MDPKNLPNLDPKLKEVYERVMKTPITPPNPPQNTQAQPPPPTTAPPQPNQPQSPVPPAVNNEPSPVPSAKPPAAELSPTPQNTFHSTQVVNPDAPIASPSKDAIPKDVAPKGKTKISPVVLVLAGVVFFVVYAVFWVSFFSVSLPF